MEQNYQAQYKLMLQSLNNSLFAEFGQIDLSDILPDNPL